MTVPAGASGTVSRVTSIGTKTTLTAAFAAEFSSWGGSGNNPSGGLVLRESSTGKQLTLTVGYNNNSTLGWNIWSWTNPTTFGSVLTSTGLTIPYTFPIVFYKVVISGGTIQPYYSYNNGKTWISLGSAITTTSYFTTAPDQWGYTTFSGSSTSASTALLSFVGN
jgi:hypothetical protein